MPDDYLRKHMKLIADYFAGDVVDSEQYCRGTRCYDWRTGVLNERPVGEYEKDLEEFLLTDPAGISKQGLDALVVIGGIGTGKSTTLREMIRKIRSGGRSCSGASRQDGKCHEFPIVIDFNISDIIGESGRQKISKDTVKMQIDDFWNIAAARLEQILGDTLTFADEAAFWVWAIDHAGVREHSRVVHRWLNQNDHQIRAFVTKVPYSGWSLEGIGQSLERQRADLLMLMSDRDLVWYRVYQLIYALTVKRSFGCRCRYVFLDNVDQLEPDVQRIVVDFVILLSDVLRARTILAIRPLTWDRSVHAHMIVRTQNHFSPALRNVLMARLGRLEKSRRASPEMVKYLRSLIRTFTSSSLWGDLFEATSGLSVRFAIRNFLNLVQSPLLRPLSEFADPLAKSKVSEIARAFFFGEGENILYDNLENLYSLGTDMRREYRLIKARILDYLIRVCDDGATELAQLECAMTIFKYSNPVLLKAVNDLLVATRPLVWSQDGHQVSSLKSRSKIAVTPIGRGYHEKLFGQLYYDEVCIARSATEVVTLDRVWAFHKELWLQDQEEIRQAVRKQGPGFYRVLYPKDKPAISAIHAINLREGVEKRDVDPPPGYDAQRLDFITAEVEKMLLPKW